MVYYGPKDLLGRYYQACHFPYRHLKVHLWKLEQAFEESWHSHPFAAACGRRAAKVGGAAMLARKRDGRIHDEWYKRAIIAGRDMRLVFSRTVWLLSTWSSFSAYPRPPKDTFKGQAGFVTTSAELVRDKTGEDRTGDGQFDKWMDASAFNVPHAIRSDVDV